MIVTLPGLFSYLFFHVLNESVKPFGDYEFFFIRLFILGCDKVLHIVPVGLPAQALYLMFHRLHFLIQ